MFGGIDLFDDLMIDDQADDEWYLGPGRLKAITPDMPALGLDDPADVDSWFAAELAASERYQATLEAKRRAGRLIEAGQPLAAKAVLVLAELEGEELVQAGALQRRARCVLAELQPL